MTAAMPSRPGPEAVAVATTSDPCRCDGRAVRDGWAGRAGHRDEGLGPARRLRLVLRPSPSSGALPAGLLVVPRPAPTCPAAPCGGDAETVVLSQGAAQRCPACRPAGSPAR